MVYIDHLDCRYQQVEGKISTLKEYSLPPLFHSLSTPDSRIRINYWQNPAGYLNLRPQLHGPYDFVVVDFRFCDAQPEMEVLAKTLKGRERSSMLLSHRKQFWFLPA